MAELRFEKLNALPGPGFYTANTLYMIRHATNTTKFDMWLSSDDGAAIRNVFTFDDINQAIADAVSSANNGVIVADITARDALTLTTITTVYVVDATGDPTVTAGAATYLYDPVGDTFIKISEAESIDFTTYWADIVGKPNSTVAEIDDAVAKRHTHGNKAVLDKFTEVGGRPYYDSAPIRAHLDVVEW